MTKKEQLKLHNPVLMLNGFDIIDTLFPDAKYKEMIVNLIKGRLNNNKISKDEMKHYYGDSINYILEKYCNNEEGMRDSKRVIEELLLRINLLKLLHNDKKNNMNKKLEIDYNIPNLNFPLELTIEHVNNLLKNYI